MQGFNISGLAECLAVGQSPMVIWKDYLKTKANHSSHNNSLLLFLGKCSFVIDDFISFQTTFMMYVALLILLCKCGCCNYNLACAGLYSDVWQYKTKVSSPTTTVLITLIVLVINFMCILVPLRKKFAEMKEAHQIRKDNISKLKLCKQVTGTDILNYIIAILIWLCVLKTIVILI